jgi:hypothetical protein
MRTLSCMVKLPSFLLPFRATAKGIVDTANVSNVSDIKRVCIVNPPRTNTETLIGWTTIRISNRWIEQLSPNQHLNVTLHVRRAHNTESACFFTNNSVTIRDAAPHAPVAESKPFRY